MTISSSLCSTELLRGLCCPGPWVPIAPGMWQTFADKWQRKCDVRQKVWCFLGGHREPFWTGASWVMFLWEAASQVEWGLVNWHRQQWLAAWEERKQEIGSRVAIKTLTPEEKDCGGTRGHRGTWAPTLSGKRHKKERIIESWGKHAERGPNHS